MRKKLVILMTMVLLTAPIFGNIAYAENTLSSDRKIAPIVSTDWIESNNHSNRLVIIDVRSAEDYAKGHIENSINVTAGAESAWSVTRDGLIMEMPDEASLFQVISKCGIKKDSLVVVVTAVAEAPNPPYPLADATRTADTLIYAGIKNVAILDGGYTKWVADGKKTTTAVPKVSTTSYNGTLNKNMIVTADYVQKSLGKSVIIDARDADVYFGVKIEPFAQKAGHIPTAKSLPTPWIWNDDGTYKQTSVLEEMASGVINADKDDEIIVYCGVGGYASSWWFVLTQVLGYENVKIYDGAAQGWVMNNFMIPYRWTL